MKVLFFFSFVHFHYHQKGRDIPGIIFILSAAYCTIPRASNKKRGFFVKAHKTNSLYRVKMRYSNPPYISWMVFHIVGFFLHERKGRGEMRSPRVLWEREWRGASKHYEGKFFYFSNMRVRHMKEKNVSKEQNNVFSTKENNERNIYTICWSFYNENTLTSFILHTSSFFLMQKKEQRNSFHYFSPTRIYPINKSRKPKQRLKKDII